MKRSISFLKILCLVITIFVSYSTSDAFLPPPGWTGWSNFTVQVEGSWHAYPTNFAIAGNTYEVNMSNDFGVVEAPPLPFALNTIRWVIPSFGIDTYISAASMYYGVSFTVPSTASYQHASVQLGLAGRSFTAPYNLGWVYSFVSLTTLDTLNSLQVGNTFTVLPWKLVDLTLKTSGTLDPVDSLRFPVGWSNRTTLGPFTPAQDSNYGYVSKIEITGTISPLVATTLGNFYSLQSARTYQWENGVLDEVYSNTPWHEDNPNIGYFTSIPINGKVFMLDAPGIPPASLPSPNDCFNGEIVELKQDFQTFVITQDGKVTSDLYPWHNHITLTWNSASFAWDTSFQVGTGNILPP